MIGQRVKEYFDGQLAVVYTGTFATFAGMSFDVALARAVGTLTVIYTALKIYGWFVDHRRRKRDWAEFRGNAS